MSIKPKCVLLTEFVFGCSFQLGDIKGHYTANKFHLNSKGNSDSCKQSVADHKNLYRNFSIRVDEF